MTLDIHTFNSGQDGKNILITAAIHGNEPCGTIGCEFWLDYFGLHKDVIQKGSVTIVPRCNPQAVKEYKRDIHVNLNRIIDHHDVSVIYEETYEYALADQIAGLVDEADIILDLHSASTPTRPFLFRDSDLDPNKEMAKIVCRTQNLQSILTGWHNHFATSAFGSVQAYGLRHNKGAVTLECGQHEEPQAAIVARDAIAHVLHAYGALDQEVLKDAGIATSTDDPVEYQLAGYAVEKALGKYTKHWAGFDFVSAGTVMAVYDTGEEIKVENDSYIVMPSKNTYVPDAAQDNWFYWVERLSGE